jgi:hypothetical protein
MKGFIELNSEDIWPRHLIKLGWPKCRKLGQGTQHAQERWEIDKSFQSQNPEETDRLGEQDVEGSTAWKWS